MSSLVTADGMSKTIRQMAQTAKFKADEADEAFLKHADPRAVQGGAIDEEASEWRKLSALLMAAAAHASKMEG
jgi:hypothetical protein